MRTHHILMLAVLALAAFWRLIPHPDNMTPIMAVALFSGIWLKQPLLRFAAPLAVMLVSDLFIGLHETMLFVYVAMLVPIALGPYLRGKGIGMYAGASVANALIFFVITNAGVWLVSGLYSHDLTGLTQCFTLALPFLWKTLAGDLFFTMALFALFSVAPAYQGRHQRGNTTASL